MNYTITLNKEELFEVLNMLQRSISSLREDKFRLRERDKNTAWAKSLDVLIESDKKITKKDS